MQLRHASQKILGAGVLALSLTMLSATLPVHAQSSPNSPTLDTTPFQETRDDNNNLGWLGLIGLIGLANLFRKPKTTQTTYRSPDPAVRSGYRE